MSSAIAPAFLENEAKKLKRDLEGWREILLHAYHLLTWKMPAAPAIIGGALTFIFLILWYLDPSVLTVIAASCLVITLLDYFVPMVSAQVFKPDNWTSGKERELEKVCKSLAANKIYAARGLKSFIGMRSERPTIFYLIAVSSLLLLTWLGNVLNNLLLTYLIVMAAVMTPGLKHQGILAPIFEMVGKVIGQATVKEVKTE